MQLLPCLQKLTQHSKILTNQRPFYQYTIDPQVISALIRAEIPIRPATDIISNEMWSLMEKCWDYVPRKRPTCENIRESLQTQGIKAKPPPGNTTEFWKENRARSNVEIGFAKNIFLQVVSLQTELNTDCTLDKNISATVKRFVGLLF